MEIKKKDTSGVYCVLLSNIVARILCALDIFHISFICGYLTK